MGPTFRHFCSRSVGRRVVVTGVGLVTCLGVGARHVWEQILEGHCGITKLTDKAYDQIPCKVAGIVPRGTEPGQLNLDAHVLPVDKRVMSLASAYALVAAEEALRDSNWEPTTAEERKRTEEPHNWTDRSAAWRGPVCETCDSQCQLDYSKNMESYYSRLGVAFAVTGVAVGMGMVGMQHIADVGQILREQGYKKVSPHFIPSVLINMATGHISLKFGLQGPNHAVSTACTTGLHALGDATRFIKYGDTDVMVAGGTEASVDPLSIAGFARMRALSTNFNDKPTLASRPFDKDRDGFVMSEGAGVVVLEELSHAVNRGAKIYGEILGYGLSADAYHITAPSEDGIGAYNCMKHALHDAGLTTEHVGYINAHATSTPLGDRAESKALSNLFKDHCSKLLVSSTKGAIGHLLGAAGSVESIFTILACHSGKAPPTVNLNQSDTGYDLNYICNSYSDWPVIFKEHRVALSNSFGFGGTNASLCIGSYNKDAI